MSDFRSPLDARVQRVDRLVDLRRAGRGVVISRIFYRCLAGRNAVDMDARHHQDRTPTQGYEPTRVA